MLNHCGLVSLAATIAFASINALPSGVPAVNGGPNSVLYAWSSDPACVSTVCAADCTLAAAAICTTNLSQSYDATVKGCSAFYYPGAAPPTPSQCTASYEQIIAAANQPANGCGGTIGGALGYNVSGYRTSDPLYAIYPANGNANCFKAPGDTSPVLATNLMPNGTAVLQTCPDSTSRRRALNKLEGRDQAAEEAQADDNVACAIEDGAWGLACTGVCLATVVSTSWLTGPFAAVAWLACLGGCSETGLKVFNNCQAAKGNDVRLSFNPIQLGDKKRRTVTESVNPCINVKEYTFDCPAMESGLLSHFECQQTGASSSSGSNGINV